MEAAIKTDKIDKDNSLQITVVEVVPLVSGHKPNQTLVSKVESLRFALPK